MAFEHIAVEKKEHITIVTMNRPEVRNAISPKTSAEMSEAFNAFDEDNEAWICIVTGAGEKAFSAGNDLKAQAGGGGGGGGRPSGPTKGGFGGITSRFDCFKPFIAAVNGLALGGGFEIALSCDIIIAVEEAVFGLPEPRVGLMAGAGGVHKLPRQIPYHAAMDMILTSKQITAQQALQYGIVSQVVKREELMNTAMNVAAEIMKGAPLSIRASKESAVKGIRLPLDEAMAQRYDGVIKMYGSEDMREGPLAFVQKRQPNWKAR